MPSKNFTADPGMFPGLIRKNLNAWYRDGYAVVKELLQNADDARASRLEIGWAPGIPPVSGYTLLDGPAIYVINDGPFTEEDERAIRLFGLGNKPDNPNKIGQFGLGLKSVFHLCEAYLYASESRFPSANGMPSREFRAFDICNPWSGIAGHPAKGVWDDLPKAAGEAIRNYLAPVVPAASDSDRPNGWLCIWLPLRRKLWQDGDRNWYFPGEFHGDRTSPPEEIFSHLEESVAAMLPMMRHVSRVRVWTPDEHGLPRAKTAVELAQGSRCVYRPDLPADVETRPMVGQLKVTRTHDAEVFCYAGAQQKLSDAELAALRSDADHWPRIEGFHDKTGFCVVRAKNDQHAAAYFTRRPSATAGTLKITWAVFLPLSAEQRVPYPLSCHDDVTLTLHGWFFVDPGRQWADVFHRSTTDHSTVEQQWNRRLAEQGTLRLVIPALTQLVATCPAADPLPAALTASIASSELFATYRSAICAQQSWGCFLESDGGHWRAIGSGTPFLEVPAPSPNAPGDLAFRVLPFLEHLVTEGVPVVSRGAPRLSTSSAGRWSTQQVRDLLRSVPLPEAVTDPTLLGYLVEFLQGLDSAILCEPVVSHEICRIARAGIQGLAPRTNESLDVALQALLGLSPRDARVRIRCSNDLIAESRRIARTLQGTSDVAVIVPEWLDPPDAPSCGTLTPAVVVSLLTELADLQPQSQQTDEFNGLRSLVALDLMRASALSGDEFRSLVIDIAHLPLFPVTSYRTRGRYNASVDVLLKAHDQGLLFVQVPALLEDLQRCLKDAEVLYLQQRDVAELIEQVSHRVPTGQASSILRALAQRPALGAPAACCELFAKLTQQTQAPTAEAVPSLRYLLHRTAAADANLTPGVAAPALLATALSLEGMADPWRQLADALLGALQAKWRLVPLETVERVPGSLWPLLGVVRLGGTSVCLLALEVLGNAALKSVFKTHLARIAVEHPSVLPQLVVDWPRTEEATRVLKALPLFTDAAGGLVEITDSTRTPGGFIVDDPEVLPTVRFLRLAIDKADPEYATRLQQLAPPLTAEDAVRLVLKGPEPGKRGKFIVETLATNERLYTTLRDELRGTPWLLTSEGKAVAPCRVAHLPDCPNVAEIVSQKTGLFTAFGQIDPALSSRIENADQRARFVRLLATGTDAIQLVGEAMRADPCFHIGLETVVLSDLHLDVLSSVFGTGCSDSQALPAIPLIDTLRSDWANSSDRIASLRAKVIAPLQRKLPSPRLTRVLEELASAHETSLRPERVKILELFNTYLKDARSLPDFGTTILPHIRLQNKTGKWVKATELTSSGLNASPDQVVSDDHRELVGTTGSGGGSPAPVDEPVAGESLDLASYLQSEYADCPSPAVGFVVALLGGGEAWAQLAKQMAGPFPLEVVLRSMAWPSFKWFRNWDHARSTCRLRIRRAKADKQRVLNLAGNWIEVPRSGPPRSLLDGFHGSQYHPTPEDCREYDAFLTLASTQAMDGRKKLDLLKGTAESLIADLYGQPPEVLTEPWRILTDTGQLSITVAQRLILESSLFHLRGQLGVRSTPELKSIFHRWDAARTREAVARQLACPSDSSDPKESPEALTEELRALLVGDTPPARQAQEQVLSAIRERLSATSYDVSSIPFELYQNADDATAELAWLRNCDHASSQRGEFDIRVTGEQIVVCHWGRAINQYRVPGTPGRDGWERGFARDLEKMLVLSSSDKGLDSDSGITTGKFGLGFKSVFFACDEPEVMSGASIHFVVRGGVFPERLSPARLKHLRAALEQSGGAGVEGTVIVLRLRPGVRSQAVVQRFMELAHVLPCFSKCSSVFRIAVEGRAVNISWTGAVVANVPGTMTGTVQPLDANARPLGSPVRLLSVSSGSESLLLAIGSDGFVSEPLQHVPTVWVTAPTYHSERLGFCLNGQFDLNPGRTQLRHTTDNQSRAEEFGRRLGSMFVECYDASQSSWEGFRRSLGLGVAATPHGLWASLWGLATPVITESREHPDAADLLRRSLFGSSEAGLLKLVHERDALPTQLGGRFAPPTRWRRVRHALTGVLARHEVLEEVESWPWFQEQVPTGAAVHACVAQAMKQIDPGVSVRPLSLLDAIREQVAPGIDVEPALADQLGGLVTRDFLLQLGRERNATWEGDELTKYLRTLRFRDGNGAWRPCQELLAGHKDGDEFRDERLRAAFAPTSTVLSQAYRPLGLLFLLACRGPMRATAAEMAEWAISADGDGNKMRGVQDYLEGGELARQLGQALQSHPAFGHSWLRRLANDVQLSSDPNRFGAVLSNLGLMQEAVLGTNSPSASAPVSRSPAIVLDRLYQVWQQRGRELLAGYERSVYPGGQAPTWSLDRLSEDRECRADWLTLFVLGALHTMGRAKDEQHRGFIELCRSRGWLHRFAAPRLDGGEWLGVLDDYLGRQVDTSAYYHWVNQFVPIYQFARWLPEYVELFLAIGRDRSDFVLTDYTRPLTSARLGGGGVSAPPISRTLGIGACFVTRELVRGSLIRNAKAHRHCFVPSQRVRRLLVDVIGAPPFDLAYSNRKWEWSCQIYDFLRTHMRERATFDLAFDIPLLLLANSQQLQEEVLDRDVMDVGEDAGDDETVLLGGDCFTQGDVIE